MLSLRGLAVSAGSVLVLASCSGDGTGPGPLATIECSDASLLSLAVGQHIVIDPAERGSCVRVPAAGSSGAEYLYVALATAGAEAPAGVKASYQLSGGAVGAVLADRASPPAMPNPTLSAFRPRTSATAFHRMLRERERASARSPGARFGLGAGGQAAAAVAPAVGSSDSFFVCGTAECMVSEFVKVGATAKHVGERVAIYVDDAAPSAANGGYSQTDLDRVGALFDDYLYPIDTLAFGRESDIDNNGVVIVLLTPRVNALSDDCPNSVILGYFFGDVDLDLSMAKSNRGEIFYGLVPDPNNATCPINTGYANRNLPPTFIHEFQHMISYNQHVLKGGSNSEDVWLNEGLSHFAEELGARKITDETKCFNNDCLSQFASGNLVNFYNYLTDPESNYLVAPASSGGSLEERGAGWSFVRWLVDHFGSDEFGRNVTRGLVNTSRLGAANVEAVVDEPFSTLVPLWQMANYLDNLPGFSGNAMLQYPTWNLRLVFENFNSQSPSQFPTEYPLVPEAVTAGGYNRDGVLRAGSGRHLLITQSPSGEAIDLQLAASDGESLPPETIRPRIAVVRIR
jgi:hypothetical protein